MKKSVIGTLLLLVILFGAAVVSAEKDVYFQKAKLELEGFKTPQLVNQGVDSKYRHNGSGDKSVYYYGYIRRPEAMSDDIFSEAYPYLCYGTGNKINEVNHNLMSFNFSLPDGGLNLNDCLYFSFYYKSEAEFESGGNTYSGETQKPEVRFNGKDVKLYELSKGNTECSEYVADGEWHLAEYYLPLDNEIYENTFKGRIDLLQLRISFLNLDKAAKIYFSGFRYGVLKLGEGDICTNSKAYTYLGMLLQGGGIDYIEVDGVKTEVKSGIHEYTFTPQNAVPSVSAIKSENVLKEPEITQKKSGEYEIKAYSLGYDSKFSENQERWFLKSVSSDGIFDENGTVIPYSVKNGDFFSIYKIFINLKKATVKITCNGNEVSDLSSFSGGDVLTVNEKIFNPDFEKIRYITLLLFYNEGKISDVVPYEFVVDETMAEAEKSFEYTLEDKNYEKTAVECLVIDCETFADVLK